MSVQATRTLQKPIEMEGFDLPAGCRRSAVLHPRTDPHITRYVGLGDQLAALTRNGDSRLPVGSYPLSTGKKDHLARVKAWWSRSRSLASVTDDAAIQMMKLRSARAQDDLVFSHAHARTLAPNENHIHHRVSAVDGTSPASSSYASGVSTLVSFSFSLLSASPCPSPVAPPSCSPPPASSPPATAPLLPAASS